MKGVIPRCMGAMVQEKFGEDKWHSILKQAGLPEDTLFLAHQDIDDGEVLKVVGAACEVLGVSLQQVADAFGDYWVNEFAPRVYKAYYEKVNNARDFLLRMDEVHEMTTRSIANAHPPRFDYEWKDDDTLMMTYRSRRGMIDFLVGLIKGVGTHFGEPLEVRRVADNQVEVVFLK